MRAAALILLLAGPAQAKVFDLDASGYVKNLYEYSRSPLDRRERWSDLTRARIGLEARLPLGASSGGGEPPARRLTLHADYDHELRAGTFLRSLDYRLLGLSEPPGHFTMEQTISSGTDGHYRHRLYRGWAELAAGGLKLRFGRQRIAWGTGKLWNPTDFLNPYQPTSLERDERRGVDALYLRRGLGALGQAELVYTLNERWALMDLVGRARGNFGRADVSLSGGKVAGSTDSFTVGGDLAADLWGGNLHAELGYTDLRVRTGFWRGMAGYEYTFSADPALSWLKDAWVVLEYFHNGRGETDKRRYDPALLLTGREIALGRDYLGGGFKRELHPLLELELYLLANLRDRSQFFSPSARWNPRDNLYLAAGWQRFGGSPGSEYGRLPNIFYLQGQWYF